MITVCVKSFPVKSPVWCVCCKSWTRRQHRVFTSAENSADYASINGHTAVFPVLFYSRSLVLVGNPQTSLMLKTFGCFNRWNVEEIGCGRHDLTVWDGGLKLARINKMHPGVQRNRNSEVWIVLYRSRLKNWCEMLFIGYFLPQIANEKAQVCHHESGAAWRVESPRFSSAL